MSSSQCNSGQSTNGIEMAQLNEMSSIKRMVAIVSGKGGVGKSSVTALAASELRRRGLQVGILDGDITGPSIPRLFGLTSSDLQKTELGMFAPDTPTGIKVMSINLLLPDETTPVIWRGPLIGNAIKQFYSETIWGDLDILLVDLPPGTGDAPLSVMQSLPLDGIIVVSSPNEMAVMVVEKAIRMASMMEKPLLGLIENMSGVLCPHCGEWFEVLGPSQGADVATRHGVEWLGSLPIDPNLAALSDGRIEEYQPPEGILDKLCAVAAGTI